MLKSALWVGGSRVVVRSLGLVSTLVLARLLSPEDFGVVAVATAVTGTLAAFTELGFSHALIHYKDADETDYATAWTLNLARSLLVAAVALAAAYPVAFAVDDPRVAPVLVVAALLPVINGLETTRLIQYEKQMRFDVMFRLMTITKVIGVTIAITAAVVWRSYWALLIGMVATSLTRTLLSYYFAPGRLWPTVRSWRKLFRFSGWLSGSEMLVALGSRLDPLFLGSLAPASTVGVFHIAREVTYSTFNEIAAPLRRVLFPALSLHESGGSEFNRQYEAAVAGLLMVVGPVSAGFALVASDLIPLVLGDQWLETVLPIQVLATFLVFTIPGRLARAAVMAAGDTRLLFWRSVVFVPLRLTAFVGGAYFYGLMGAVAGAAFGMMVDMVISIAMARHVSGIPVRRQFQVGRRSWIALAGMAACVGLFRYAAPGISVTGSASMLAVSVALGCMSYVGLHLLLWRAAGLPDGPERTVLNLLIGVWRRLEARRAGT